MNAWFTARHAVGLASSLGVHATVLVALTLAPVGGLRARAPSTVELELTPRTSPAPRPPPRPAPEPPPSPEPVAPTTTPAAPEPAEAPPPPEAAPELVDLSGVTLTDDGPGAGWASAVGDGSSLDAPLRSPRRNTSPPRAATSPALKPANLTHAAPPRPPPPPLVAVADLARRPSPPALDGLLQANYPLAARHRGEAGQALVIARIEADGVVRSARIASATMAEFGVACQRTVVGSRWEPPRDRQGRSVATEVSYTCRFEVRR